MSYLRGPLTREQIQSLMKDSPDRAAAATVGAAPSAASDATLSPSAPVAATSPTAPAGGPPVSDREVAVAPPVADGVPVYHLDPAAPWAATVGAVAGGSRLQAGAVARVHLRYDDVKAGIDHVEEWEAVWFPLGRTLDPETAKPVDYDDRDLRVEAPVGASYTIPDAPVDESAYFKRAAADLKGFLARSRSVSVFRNPSLKLFSRVGEARSDFEQRCDAAAQQEADRETAKIRDRLEQKKDRLESAAATARRQMEQAQVDSRSRGQNELLAGAGAVLSILLGGRGSARSMGSRAGSALGSASSRRAMKDRAEQRERAAKERLDDREEDLRQLEQEILDEVTGIDQDWQAKARDIEEFDIGLESTDVDVAEVALVWIPT
jgi:hypothetical protein